MKTITKKTISVLLAFAMLVGLFCVSFVNSSAATTTTCPTCGQQSVAKHYHPADCTRPGYYLYVCTNMFCKGYSAFEKIDPKGHGSINGFVTVTTVLPTCTQKGEKQKICKDCGVVVETTEISATGHVGVWQMDFEPTADHDGQKTQYCTKCGEKVSNSQAVKVHTHQLGYTSAVREATCTANGLSGSFCKICNACYNTAVIEKTGHTSANNSVWVTGIKATCTADGTQIGYCAVCGENVGEKTVNKLGHGETVKCITTAASCTSDGESTSYCMSCGEAVTTEKINALGHDEGVWTVSKNPTCILDGEEILSCTRCGHVIDSKKIDKLGHDNGYWKIAYEATPEHDGRMNCFCSRCNAILDTKDFKLHTHTPGHTEMLVEATCTADGEKAIFCAVCGVVYDTAVIPATNHNYNSWYKNGNGTHSCVCDKCNNVKTENCTYIAVVTEPTCTQIGFTTYTCTVCGFTYVSDYTPALGHDFGDWKEDNESTHTRSCKRCAVEETKPHIWGAWVFNNDNKCFKDGTKTRHCALCGATQNAVAENTSKIVLFFEKIRNFFAGFFTINVNGGNGGETVIVDIDSDSNADSDSDSKGFVS